MPGVGAALTLVAAWLVLLGPACVRAVAFEAVSCEGGVPGVRVLLTDAEFFDAYTGVFRMSDGSAVLRPAAAGGEGGGYSSPLFRESMMYMHGLMRMVGIELDPEHESRRVEASGGSDEAAPMSFRLCGAQVGRVFMWSVVGNMVASPGDGGVSSQSLSARALPSVSIDSHTGRLEMATSLNAMRSYFLETMLIISILAIARLSLVQTVSVPLPSAPAEAAAADKLSNKAL